MSISREGKIVTACGLFGGVVAFLYVYSTDSGPLGEGLKLIVSFCLYCCGGVAAAVIGVFLLANTDRTDDLRLASTGLLFGIFWIQILNQAGGTISSYGIQKKAQEVQQKALTEAAEPSAEGIENLVKLNKELLIKAGDAAGQAENRIAIGESILQSVVAAKRLGNTDHEASEKALEALKEAVTSSQFPEAATIFEAAE